MLPEQPESASQSPKQVVKNALQIFLNLLKRLANVTIMLGVSTSSQ